MWPRTSMRVALVCFATWDAIVFAFSSFNAVLSIRIFIISLLSNCLSISLMMCADKWYLPIQIVGFSWLNSCFILCFALGVIMFVFSPWF